VGVGGGDGAVGVAQNVGQARDNDLVSAVGIKRFVAKLAGDNDAAEAFGGIGGPARLVIGSRVRPKEAVMVGRVGIPDDKNAFGGGVRMEIDGNDGAGKLFGVGNDVSAWIIDVFGGDADEFVGIVNEGIERRSVGLAFGGGEGSGEAGAEPGEVKFRVLNFLTDDGGACRGRGFLVVAGVDDADGEEFAGCAAAVALDVAEEEDGVAFGVGGKVFVGVDAGVVLGEFEFFEDKIVAGVGVEGNGRGAK